MFSLFIRLWVSEEINPRKRKLVGYVLDADKVKFDLSQDPECHRFCHVNVGVFCLA
jgi:hypothetical protein